MEKLTKKGLNVEKENEMKKKQVISFTKVDVSPVKAMAEINKIKYAIVFKYKINKKTINNKVIKEIIYYPEVIKASDILKDVTDPNLKDWVKERATKWLREFLNELPRREDIKRKEVLNEIYETSEYGVKILKDTIGNSNNNRYLLDTPKGIKNVTKGEMIAYALWKATIITGKVLIPTLGLGPEKVVYYHTTDKLTEILKTRNLLEEFRAITTPQKRFQRLHKILSPLTNLSAARVYVGDAEEEKNTKITITNKLLGIDTTFTEGILLVSKTYADNNKLVEGAKLSYTLKSLIHIVPDNVLVINGKQYDVVLSADENKWKASAEKLGTILKAFTGKTPDVNARIYKIVEFKANNMHFTRLENQLKDDVKEKLETIRDILKNSNNISKILTKDGKSFKPEYEEFFFDLLSIETFNKDEEASYEGLEREKHPVLTELGCLILNKMYIKDTTYTENGEVKFTPNTWLVSGNSTPMLNNRIFSKMGGAMAKLLFQNVICAKFVGCSGTVLPLSMKAKDAYPVAYNVTDENRVLFSNNLSKEEKMERIEYIRERNSKLTELGIGTDLMYVQRHPSMLGVWTKLYYSPSTKLFYVDELLWKTYFGGDFDGDNFVGLYPYHILNKDLNKLNRKVIDPIDNDRMTRFIDKDETRKFLTFDLFKEINEIRSKYESENKIDEIVRKKCEITTKITEMNPNYKEKVDMKYNDFFKKAEYQDWAKAQDGKEIVGKIHSVICNALSFFTEKLDVEEELRFSTYFIFFHIQPAIEGLKHDEEGKIPNTKELIKEMTFVYREMFGDAKYNKLKLPLLEDVENHKKIYAKVRSFETIGLLNKAKTEYINADLFYKKDEYMEIAKRINTRWTQKYKNLIKYAERYFKKADIPTTEVKIISIK